MNSNSESLIIDVKNLKKKYKGSENEALKGINLKINKGEFFGLLGPNSAGKTTLISIMCGILKISKGDVFIMDTNIKHSSRKFFNKIGLIPQEIALYPTLTIKENLQFFGKMQEFSEKN